MPPRRRPVLVVLNASAGECRACRIAADPKQPHPDRVIVRAAGAAFGVMPREYAFDQVHVGPDPASLGHGLLGQCLCVSLRPQHLTKNTLAVFAGPSLSYTLASVLAAARHTALSMLAHHLHQKSQSHSHLNDNNDSSSFGDDDDPVTDFSQSPDSDAIMIDELRLSAKVSVFGGPLEHLFSFLPPDCDDVTLESEHAVESALNLVQQAVLRTSERCAGAFHLLLTFSVRHATPDMPWTQSSLLLLRPPVSICDERQRLHNVACDRLMSAIHKVAEQGASGVAWRETPLLRELQPVAQDSSVIVYVGCIDADRDVVDSVKATLNATKEIFQQRDRELRKASQPTPKPHALSSASSASSDDGSMSFSDLNHSTGNLSSSNSHSNSHSSYNSPAASHATTPRPTSSALTRLQLSISSQRSTSSRSSNAPSTPSQKAFAQFKNRRKQELARAERAQTPKTPRREPAPEVAVAVRPLSYSLDHGVVRQPAQLPVMNSDQLMKSSFTDLLTYFAQRPAKS